MRKRKRLASLALSAAMLVSLLGGCQGNVAPAETTAAATAAEEAKAEEESTETAETKEAETEKKKDSQSHYTKENYEMDFAVRDENGNRNYKNRSADGETGVVVSSSVYADRAGLEILEAGGNAVDAAAAVSLALGVTMPAMCGVGGGGFMMIRSAEGDVVFLDGQTVAPAAATPSLWQFDESGACIGNQNFEGGKVVCTPTLLTVLDKALKEYGTMTLEEVMQPAIRLAEEGFEVGPALVEDINVGLGRLVKYEHGGEIYLNNGFPLEEGSHFENPALAETYQLIAQKGIEEFYTGEIAEKIVAEAQKYGGVLTMDDMERAMETQLIEREPVVGNYRGYQIISSSPASSGGTMVVEILNILENFDMASMEVCSPEYISLLMETSKLIFADRAAYMGDPAFFDLPVDGLRSDAYGAERAKEITLGEVKTYEAGDPWKYTPDDSIWNRSNRKNEEELYEIKESPDTTHFSIADKYGNMVSMTQTNRAQFGSGLFPEGCGFVLNNCGADFAAGEGKPNSIAGNKKPLSSMSPTLVLKEDGSPFLVVGTPGATTIFQRVAHMIHQVIDYDMSVDEAIMTPKYCWTPATGLAGINYDMLGEEDHLTEETLKTLEEMGYTIDPGCIYSRLEAIMYMEDGTLHGCGDPRDDSKALGY